MNEKKIKINTNISLPDVVSSIRKGEWKIPNFQREFVWEKKKVVELLDSMYKEFPIGSFFLWIPPEEYTKYSKELPELKIEQGNHKFYVHFILDGQQRLTSLYAVYRGLVLDNFDYSDICFDLDSEKFNTNPRDSSRNISVHQIMNSDDYLDLYNGLENERKKKFMKVKATLTNYPFPVIIIEDKSVEEACKIFERINQSGRKLSISDLVFAVTWDKDFELKKKINEFNEEIAGTFGKIDYEVFNETLALIIKKQCTRAFQLKMTPDDVKSRWAEARKAIGKAIQFLRTNLKVVSYEYIPYRDMLALIAYYFYECQEKNTDIDKKFLEDWFWKASFSNRYSGSTFTKIGEDRTNIFDKAIRGDKVKVSYNVNLNVETLKTIQMGRNTALRNALILLMIQNEPRSFIDSKPIDIHKDAISEFNDSEKHHIFPKKFLKSEGITDKKATDLLVNFCLIDSELNKEISGTQPKEYFESFRKRNKEDFGKSLKSHLISADKDSAIWTNDYKLFIEQRAGIINTLVRSKIGDFTASIEEQMNSSPNQLIEKLEQKIREIINKILYESLGEGWWNVQGIVPEDIKDYAKRKIKEESSNKPYITNEEWNTPQRILEQLTIMHYEKLILSNWNVFEDIFGSKEKLQTHIKSFSILRNQVDHVKTIDSTEKKSGEAAIEWLFRCIQEDEAKETIEETNDEAISEFYVKELNDELRKKILSLGSDIDEVKNKWYTAFKRKIGKNRNFVSIKIMKLGLKVYVTLEEIDPKKLGRNVSSVGHLGTGDYEFLINSAKDIDYIAEQIKKAYEKSSEFSSKSEKDAEFIEQANNHRQIMNYIKQHLEEEYLSWAKKINSKVEVHRYHGQTYPNGNATMAYFAWQLKDKTRITFEFMLWKESTGKPFEFGVELYSGKSTKEFRENYRKNEIQDKLASVGFENRSKKDNNLWVGKELTIKEITNESVKKLVDQEMIKMKPLIEELLK